MNREYYDILQVSARAKSRAQAKTVCDATVGMLFDDERKLFRYRAVEVCLRDLFSLDLQYQSAIGSAQYRSSFIRQLEQKTNLDLTRYEAALTVGGTGGLSLVARHCCSAQVILPDFGWPNYEKIFGQPEYRRYSYRDPSTISSALDSLAAEDGAPLLVINDPAQNPTGYTLLEEDYERLLQVVNRYAATRPLNLLLDLAYIDYSDDPARPFRFAQQLDPAIQVYLVFSGSKSYGLYGLRSGAVLFDRRNQSARSDFASLARALYSCPPNTGFAVIDRIAGSSELQRLMDEDLAETRRLLATRSHIMLDALDRNGIEHLDYQSGFYLTLSGLADAYQTAEQLEKNDVFFVPIDEHHMRVAICSVPTPLLGRAVQSLKEVISHEVKK